MKPSKQIPIHIARAVAVEALCDPKTVQRLLAGGKVRDALRDRIEPVLRARGLLK